MIGRRILLVEDEFLIAMYTAEILENAGLIVVGPADRLGRAMELARTESFEAAVLDINLAGELVWPVTEVLARRGIPFVLLSGYGAGLDVPPSCRDVPRLAKPLSESDLCRMLAALSGAGDRQP